MEILTITAAVAIPTAGWLLACHQIHKLSQRFDIQARLIADLADLITDGALDIDEGPRLHLVQSGVPFDLAALEAFILRLHMCHHRRPPSGRKSFSGR